MDPAPIDKPYDPYAALRFRDYRLYATGNISSIIGWQMTGVAVGWELYERTGSALVLGGVGFFQALPVLLCALPAGHIADRYDRKTIVMATQLIRALCLLSLAILSYYKGAILAVYLCLFFASTARSFSIPSRAALLPQIVPLEVFRNAVTWNNTIFEVSSILGPAIGGLVIAKSGNATLVYIIDAVSALIQFVCLAGIRGRQQVYSSEPITLSNLLAGIHFVRKTKIILSALTLDLFAVLLGGATTLLPIFAKDILHIGPEGLGWLRAAPSIGACTMAITLAHLPSLHNPGKKLLWAVAGFGVATIFFGLSKWFWFSFLMLVLIGMTDSVSVVIRHTLVQLRTPDALRGRVSAVNGLFIGLSNELGGFESGLVAAAFGPVISVVSGGIGTLIVVALVAWKWPEIRRLRSLSSGP